MQDSQEYKDKKAFFQKVITLYGRNVVIEMLQEKSIEIHKLHLANSNKSDGAIKKILLLAKALYLVAVPRFDYHFRKKII